MFIYYLIALIIFFIIIVLYFTKKLVQVSLSTFFTIITGVILGLLVGALFSIPLSRLPGGLGQWLPLVVSVLLAIAGTTLLLAKKEKISSGFNDFFSGVMEFGDRFRKEKDKKDKTKKEEKKEKGIVVDTSVLIDGRIEDIAKIGFISETLIIPRFILDELQKIADSREPLRRNRGRRGLEILNTLSKKSDVEVQIIDDDFPKISKVDSKLVKLAKKRGRKILTTDYNLNRVAEIQKVKVLNINELNNVIKTVVLPGEKLQVKVIQEGKEKGQGIGYLEDGTMIVIEGGDKYIGETVKCEVTRIFQTVAGKMVFVAPKGVVKKEKIKLA